MGCARVSQPRNCLERCGIPHLAGRRLGPIPIGNGDRLGTSDTGLTQCRLEVQQERTMPRPESFIEVGAMAIWELWNATTAVNLHESLV